MELHIRNLASRRIFLSELWHGEALDNYLTITSQLSSKVSLFYYLSAFSSHFSRFCTQKFFVLCFLIPFAEILPESLSIGGLVSVATLYCSSSHDSRHLYKRQPITLLLYDFAFSLMLPLGNAYRAFESPKARQCRSTWCFAAYGEFAVASISRHYQGIHRMSKTRSYSHPMVRKAFLIPSIERMPYNYDSHIVPTPNFLVFIQTLIILSSAAVVALSSYSLSVGGSDYGNGWADFVVSILRSLYLILL